MKNVNPKQNVKKKMTKDMKINSKNIKKFLNKI
jgi:hypothetical protein